jgi:hypothetical protein
VKSIAADPVILRRPRTALTITEGIRGTGLVAIKSCLIDIYEHQAIKIDRLFKTDNPLDAASNQTVLAPCRFKLSALGDEPVWRNIVELWQWAHDLRARNHGSLLNEAILD